MNADKKAALETLTSIRAISKKKKYMYANKNRIFILKKKYYYYYDKSFLIRNYIIIKV